MPLTPAGQDALSNGSAPLNAPQLFVTESDEPTMTLATSQQNIPPQPMGYYAQPVPAVNGAQASTAYNGSHIQEEDDSLEDTMEDAWHSRTNWQRIVADRPYFIEGQTTTGIPPEPVNIPPLSPLPPRPPLPSSQRHLPAFWISIFLLLVAVIAALSGIVVVALGHGVFMPPPPSHAGPSLQINPSSIALGAMITLHGSNFSPNGRVGLSYDASIPVVDTDGKSIILADKQGNFTDTVIVEPEWHAGPHTIHAEDALLHKIASFILTVTGHSPSLRPVHLQLSASAVDLGNGDQATNSAQTVTLSNIGGGQETWQSSVTQPWLMLTPRVGTLTSSQSTRIVIAADRSNLGVGSYGASVIFSSDVGQLTLSVKMEVTPLQPAHEAVLQLTPAVLSFSATDGDVNPPAQVVTVSNPGLLPLQWSVTSLTGDGSGWLAVSPASGSVAKGGSESVKIGVDTSTLLPGTYSGLVKFAGSGLETVQGSPASLYVSLTVTPQCTLQVSPGGLSFAGVYAQPAPASQVIGLSVPQGCSTSLHWSANTTTDNGGNWLAINENGDASGITPASPSVSVHITGLTPNTYTGAVIFSTTVGTQTLPVTLTIGQPTTPGLVIKPATMTFNGVIGQPSPDPQTLTITNTGGSKLVWNATATTSVGDAWLAVTPATGTLSPGASTPVTVTATLLSSLVPATYNGAITVTGSDSAGNAALGSPQQIPVSFTVQAACAISVAPTTLNFAGVAGGSTQMAQEATINASGACVHRLDWSATVTTSSGDTWLTTTPTAGEVSTRHSSMTSVSVILAGLATGTYTGKVTITATDHVTNQPVGSLQDIPVILTVQPPCTLQAPSSAKEIFNSEAGLNPSSQTFTASVIGACKGDITITPTVTLASGKDWLRVSPATAIVAGGSATFTIAATSASLPAATYSGSISLSAVNNGITITGSPQTVDVTLNVLPPPALSVGPDSLTINVTTGVTNQSFDISNTGGLPLNWRAALAPGAPSFVNLSAKSGQNLAAGRSESVNVVVDATGVASGIYNTSVTVKAIDPITGDAVTGSPVTISVVIDVAQPSMQVDADAVTFNATAGDSTTPPRSITVTNAGGGTLTWTASTPSGAPWLHVSPTSDNDAAGASTTVTFTADATSLPAGKYTTTVTITPADGAGTPVDVTVTFTVTAPPSPTATTPTTPTTPTGTATSTTP